MADGFQCVLVTPEAQVLDEELTYVSLPGWDGQVGVAPLRAPMLVKLGDGPMRISAEGQAERWYFVAGGFAQMQNNRLTILTTQAVPADELDAEEQTAALREAEAHIARTDEAFDQKQREVHRARVKVDLANRY